MKYSITQRCKGTKAAYWVLRVWLDGDATPAFVYTGKGTSGLGYVQGIRSRRYPNATQRGPS